MSEIIECQGFCPKCGSDRLEWGDSGAENNAYYYEFECKECHTKAREWCEMNYIETIIQE